MTGFDGAAHDVLMGRFGGRLSTRAVLMRMSLWRWVELRELITCDFAAPIERRSTAKDRGFFFGDGLRGCEFLVIFRRSELRIPRPTRELPGPIASVLGCFALRFLGFFHGFPLFLGILLHQFLLVLSRLAGLNAIFPNFSVLPFSGNRVWTTQPSMRRRSKG
jgi:hypothetical protein